MPLLVEDVPIESLVPFARNPRNNAMAVDKVAASILEFGFRNPIVCDEKMVVIAGHTRLLAARSLGLTVVPVHIARGMTEEQVRAFRIADNRTGEEATWASDLLVAELASLAEAGYDMALTGFNPDELKALIEVAVSTPAFVPAVPEHLPMPPMMAVAAPTAPPASPVAAPDSPDESAHFKPTLMPTLATHKVNAGEVDQARTKLEGQYQRVRELHEMMCPECGATFYIDEDPAKLNSETTSPDLANGD